MTPRDDLFDETKPYARFYESDQDVICQIHTWKIEGLPFGRVGWRISASICGPDGKTLEQDGEKQILRAPHGEVYAHEVTVQAETVEDLAALLETERRSIARLAANAAEVWRSARDIT